IQPSLEEIKVAESVKEHISSSILNFQDQVTTHVKNQSLESRQLLQNFIELAKQSRNELLKGVADKQTQEEIIFKLAKITENFNEKFSRIGSELRNSAEQ